MDRAHSSKLLRDYGTSSNSWPGVTLLLAVFTTGGRAHGTFAGALRGWCVRAAERRASGSAVAPRALAAGLYYRVAGVTAVQLQLALHGLLAWRGR